MRSGIHANRVARASFDTVTAINTAQRVDFVANRKFFYRIVRIFSGLDVDAFRRTRRGTEKTSSTLHRAVLFQRQSMTATKGVRIRRALFGVLHGDRRRGVACQAKQLQDVNDQIPPEPVAGHEQAAHYFGKIESLPERHFFNSFHELF